MNNETIREAFDKVWELDKEIQDFQITKNVKGRKLQLRILGCWLVQGEESSPLDLYMNDYVINGVCSDSKWVLKFVDLYDVIALGTNDIPKQFLTKIANLNKYLIKTFKDNAYMFAYAYSSGYCENKENSFKAICKILKEKEEELKEAENTVIFKLNNSYNASYVKGGKNVKVGCQTFSKDVILKLAAAIQ